MTELWILVLAVAGGLQVAYFIWSATTKLYIDSACAFVDQMTGQFKVRINGNGKN